MPKTIISVKETKKLLGSAAKELTDDEIKKMLLDCERIARQTVREYMVRKSEVVDYKS